MKNFKKRICGKCKLLIENPKSNNQLYHEDCYKIYRKEYMGKYKQNPLFLTKNKKYQKKYKDKTDYNSNYYQKNKGIMKKKSKEWADKNPKKVKLKKKLWCENNKEKIRQYQQKAKINNPVGIRLRNLVWIAFRRYTKTGKITTSKMYGIDYKAIIEHLKPFPEDISKYHIDHINPLCSFKFVNEDCSINNEEVKKAFAPENHQWLLAEENLKKIAQDKRRKIGICN